MFAAHYLLVLLFSGLHMHTHLAQRARENYMNRSGGSVSTWVRHKWHGKSSTPRIGMVIGQPEHGKACTRIARGLEALTSFSTSARCVHSAGDVTAVRHMSARRPSTSCCSRADLARSSTSSARSRRSSVPGGG